MKFNNKKLVCICLCIQFMLIMFISPVLAHDDKETHNREYKIKAAFIYNFLKGVDWPEEVFPDPNTPIKIGVLGEDPFGKTFDPIVNKTVKGRKIEINRFAGPSQAADSNDPFSDIDVDNITSCNLLFICSSEEEYAKEILDLVSDRSVLSVSEISDFIKIGGVINFVPDTEKAVFEVNLVASKKAKLVISSKLLRIADKIIDGKQAKDRRGGK